MKNRNEINIDQVLNDYLAAISPEQLIAELETPQRAVLMSIPDDDFFHIPTETEICAVKGFEIEQTITLVGDFSTDSLIWNTLFGQDSYISSIAANQELALAA
jgi:hypothetical protein